MTTKLTIAIIGASLALVSSTAHAERFDNRVQELYHIFDFKTDAPKGVVIKAATDGYVMNASHSDTLTPIVMDAPPATPARFKLVNPLANSPLAGLAAMGGQMSMEQFKQAQCDGAVWIANVVRRVQGSQELHLTLCLFPYAQGYQLDIYGHDVHKRGGSLGTMLGRAVGEALVGDESDWTRRLITDLVKTIQARTNARTTWVEGQPELDAKYEASLADVLADRQSAMIGRPGAQPPLPASGQPTHP